MRKFCSLPWVHCPSHRWWKCCCHLGDTWERIFSERDWRLGYHQVAADDCHGM